MADSHEASTFQLLLFRRRPGAAVCNWPKYYIPSMNLSVELIAEIRMLGLDVSSAPDFDPDHIAFPNGVVA